MGLILVIGLLVQGLAWSREIASRRQLATVTLSVVPTVKASDPKIGPLSAPVTIIEFSDFTCEFCATAEQELTRAMTQLPGVVRVVWKDFPRSELQSSAWQAAVAARCAARQQKFVPYRQALFTHQAELNAPDLYTRLADELDLNQTAFSQCLADPSVRQQVAVSKAEGVAAGLEAVPTFFLNDQKLSGVISSDVWLKYIQDAWRSSVPASP